MATWKKVIVSGSDAELRTLFTSLDITSSLNISASGHLYGNLPVNENLDYVVVYNDTDTPYRGRLERKLLNLVSTVSAPNLFLLDQYLEDSTYDSFKLSHDTGSSQITGVTPYTRLSASLLNNGVYDIFPTVGWLGLNSKWVENIDGGGNANTLYYGFDGNSFIINTGSVETTRNGLITGSIKKSLAFSINAIDNNNNAVPAYDPSAISPDNYNYFAKSFNDGGIGELRVFVNSNNSYGSIDLESNYGSLIGGLTGDYAGVQYILSPTRSNASTVTGDPDPVKHARSGSIFVADTKQNDGYNYMYIIHTGSKDGEEFSYITNFVEWFYDNEGASEIYNLSENTSETSANFGGVFDINDTASISGIKFFTATSADEAYIDFSTQVRNQYRNIYLSTNSAIKAINVSDTVIDYIEVTQSTPTVDQNHTYYEQIDDNINSSISYFYQAPLLNQAGVNETTTRIQSKIGLTFQDITGDFYQPTGFQDQFTTNNIENADNVISFDFEFNHIPDHKTVDSIQVTGVSEGNYMVNTLNVNANEYQFEDFRGEQFRLISQSYSVTDTIDSSAYDWDGEKNIVDGGDGYDKGAIQYYSHLLYPTKAGVGGVFNPSLGPNLSQGQPNNYNSATGEREYLRYYKLTSAQNQVGYLDFNLELKGLGRLVGDGSTLFTSNDQYFKMYMWRSNIGINSAFSGDFINVLAPAIRTGASIYGDLNTRYLPLTDNVSNITYSDGNNGGGVNTPLSVIKMNDNSGDNTINGEYLIFKVVIPQGWTGWLDAMALTLGPSPTKVLGTTYTLY